MGFAPSAALSAAAFALLHPNAWDFPALFILGVVLAWAYELRGSLLAPVVLHAANNAFTFATLFMLMAPGR